MEQQKVTINELVKRLTDEMLRIGYSKQTIYRNFIPNMMHVVHFYEATGTVYYSPASSAEYLSYNIERCKRDRKSTRQNSSHSRRSRMPSSA